MAKLITTKAEKKAATYLDWDDATLGKACKKVALILGDNSGEVSMKYTGAAVFLISEAIKADSFCTTVELENATDPEPLGDWLVTVERLGKFKVLLEMEVHNSDGSENDQLWETVEISAVDSDEAIHRAMNMDFGVRRPTGCTEIIPQ